MKKSFDLINWPKNERVRKEYLIVLVGTLFVGLVAAGVDALAQRILTLIY